MRHRAILLTLGNLRMYFLDLRFDWTCRIPRADIVREVTEDWFTFAEREAWEPKPLTSRF